MSAGATLQDILPRILVQWRSKSTEEGISVGMDFFMALMFVTVMVLALVTAVIVSKVKKNKKK